jgi:hypothetical protein
MEKIFNSFLYQIGQPFKLSIIAITKIQLIAFQVPILHLTTVIQEWEYFITLQMVLSQDNIGVIILNMFMEVQL